MYFTKHHHTNMHDYRHHHCFTLEVTILISCPSLVLCSAAIEILRVSVTSSVLTYLGQHLNVRRCLPTKKTGTGHKRGINSTKYKFIYSYYTIIHSSVHAMLPPQQQPIESGSSSKTPLNNIICSKLHCKSKERHWCCLKVQPQQITVILCPVLCFMHFIYTTTTKVVTTAAAKTKRMSTKYCLYAFIPLFTFFFTLK